jgi:phenylpyruvate tautomerase PptA (4-oxalocrotonate tautomerase family)
MPFINITTSRTIDTDTKNFIQLEVGKLMPILPGKTIDNTLLCINDCCSMFMGGKPNDGFFVDIRLFKSSPEESKKEFAAKLYNLLKTTLGIKDEDCTYMNFVELSTWSSNGNLLI